MILSDIVKVLLLTVHSGVTPDDVRGPFRLPETDPLLTACKGNDLTLYYLSGSCHSFLKNHEYVTKGREC